MAKRKPSRRGAAPEAPSEPSLRVPDDDAPDLWDDPGFEEADPATEPDSGGWDPVKPIGPGNPPRGSTYRKGDPSPNAKGRPIKARLGPIGERLSQKAPNSNLTELEAINRRLVVEANKNKPSAMKLYDERKARDAAIRENQLAYARYEEEAALQRLRPSTNPARQQQMLKDHTITVITNAIEARHPGLLDAIRKLRAMGAFEEEDGIYMIAASLRAYFPD